MTPRRKVVGARAPVARCLDCDTWTTWAADGTAIIRHKPWCPGKKNTVTIRREES